VNIRPLSIRAFAKVNLDLRVLHRRPDGYHEIRTLFQTLELHDTLTFRTTRAPFEIQASGEPIPLDSSNIAWKAAQSIWKVMGCLGDPHGVSVQIVKRIPVQAGLGGGSSDAAATLIALNRLWNARLSPLVLFELAAALGADVPFFLLGGTAVGGGRGDVLYPLADLPPRHVVLTRPAAGVSTADAYGWLDAATRAVPARQRLNVAWPPGSMEVANDFEPIVAERVPEVATLRTLLVRSGAELAMMSGSGSAVYGLFAREGAARQAVAGLQGAGVNTWQTEFRARRRPER
jgi:4-diphosphocytidyl-2-C-methyl-D-erythritol kinase